MLRTIRKYTHFEDVAPIFTLVIKSLIESLRHLNEVVSVHALSAEEVLCCDPRGERTNEHIICHLGDLIHLCA